MAEASIHVNELHKNHFERIKLNLDRLVDVAERGTFYYQRRRISPAGVFIMIFTALLPAGALFFVGKEVPLKTTVLTALAALVFNTLTLWTMTVAFYMALFRKDSEIERLYDDALSMRKGLALDMEMIYVRNHEKNLGIISKYIKELDSLEKDLRRFRVVKVDSPLKV